MRTPVFRAWAAHRSLADAWRHTHPTTKLYSFHSIPHNLRVRLDRFMCTQSILPRIQHSDYLGRIVSDHDAHTVNLTWGPPLPPIPTGRLPKDCLLDPVFRHEQSETIQHYFAENTGSTPARSLEWDAFKLVVHGACIRQITGVRHTLEREVQATEQQVAQLSKAADQREIPPSNWRRPKPNTRRRAPTYDDKTFTRTPPGPTVKGTGPVPCWPGSINKIRKHSQSPASAMPSGRWYTHKLSS